MPPVVVRRTLKLAGLEVPLVEATGSGDDPVLTVIAGVHGGRGPPAGQRQTQASQRSLPRRAAVAWLRSMRLRCTWPASMLC